MYLCLLILAGCLGVVIGYIIRGKYFSQQISQPEEINQKEMEIVARNNFFVWIEALKTKDPKKVANLYHDELSFLPTVSNEFKKGQPGAEEYFIHFLQKNPKGSLVKDEIKVLTAEIYLHSGFYDFEIEDKGEKIIVEARFSFLWILDNGEWKIIHHHSSEKPKGH